MFPIVIYSFIPSLGPNELSIRDASLIHPVLGQGGLPKGPRAYISSLFVRWLICDNQVGMVLGPHR